MGIRTGKGNAGISSHSLLLGLDQDDHPQYTRLIDDEVITGNWSFGQITLTNSPTLPTHAATKGYVDAIIRDYDWQNSVLDHINDPPGGPTLGHRYLIGDTPTGVWVGHADEITEWDGTSWVYSTLSDGMATWVEDENRLKIFDGASWTTFETTLDHGSITGLGDDDHTQYFKVVGRTDENLTLSGTGSIQSADGDTPHLLGRAAVGFATGGVSDQAYFAHRDHLLPTEYALTQESGGNTSLNAKSGGQVIFRIANSFISNITSSGLAFGAGARINEFSIDGTLAGDSDVAVPTEQAVKTYVDNLNHDALVGLSDDDHPQYGHLSQSEVATQRWTFPDITINNTPTLASDAVRKDYVDSVVQGLDWQESVLEERNDPGTETTGFRYLIGTSPTGVWIGHANEITEWNGSSWDYTSPSEGMAVWIEATDGLKVYNGSAWVTFGSTIDHGNLNGLGDDDHTIYLLASGARALTGHLTPDGGNTYDLGASGDEWKDLYLSGNFRDNGNLVTVAQCKTAYDHSQLTTGNPHSIDILDLSTKDHHSLDGLADDDHSQYLNIARHDLTARHGSSVVDHGGIGGLGDDDHSQYLNVARHDLTARHGSSVVDHGGIGGLGDDDHTQYLLVNATRDVAGHLLPDDDTTRNLGSTGRRWGNVFVSGPLQDGSNTMTVLEGKTAYDHSQLVAGNPHAIDITDLSTKDHHNLDGLADDDHTQYFMVTGRTNENLTLSGTGVIQSVDGDYTHQLGRAAIGFAAGGVSDWAYFAHRDHLLPTDYALAQDDVGNTYLNAKTGNEVIIRTNNSGASVGNFGATGLLLKFGARVEEFSIDGTLTGDSDNAVPTEKAVKTYADTKALLSHTHTESEITDLTHLALGETSVTAYRGDRGKTAYDHSQLASGNPHAIDILDLSSRDHHNLTGLTDDDHSQYFTVTGRTDENLTLSGTGKIISADGDTYHEFGRGYIGYDGANSDMLTLGHRDMRSSLNYALKQTNLGSTYINAATSRQVAIRINDSNILQVTASGMNFNTGNLTLTLGTSVNEFSIDGTLADNSNNAAPTEQAVKTYVDSLNHDALVGLADDDHSQYFMVTGRTDEDLTLSGTGKIASTDGDYLSTLGRAAIGGIATDLAIFSHRDRATVANLALSQTAAGDTIVNCSTGQNINLKINDSLIASLDASGMAFVAGTAINEFSTDDTLAGNSDNAVPTEQAVKAYHEHDTLTGLADDDHTQYFKVTGRSNEDLTLSGTGKIVSADGDYTHLLGRAAIGQRPGAAADTVGFSHRDHQTLTNYALVQTSAGSVYLNAPTGQTVNHRINDADVMTMSASGLTFGSAKTVQMGAGTSVNEFSIDGTLAGDSDDALPTEKAVKAYVDTLLSIGSANRKYFPLFFNAPYPSGADMGEFDGSQTNVTTGSRWFSYGLAIPHSIGGKSLYVDGVQVNLSDADAANYISNTRFGHWTGTTNDLVLNNSVDRTSPTTYEIAITPEDVSGSDLVYVQLNSITDTVRACDIAGVFLRCYYA
jgi:hypothetical protein